MTAPLLLSDIDLNNVETTYAPYFTDPAPFRKQIEVTRRFSTAVKALGGATSANAPNKWQYINLVVAFDDLGNGDFKLAEFMASRPATPTLPDAARCYHLSLDRTYLSLAIVQMELFNQFPTHVLTSLIENDKITKSLDATTKKKVVDGMQTAISKNFAFGKDSIETLIADQAYASSIGSSDTAKTFVRKLTRLAVLVRLPQDIAYLWDTTFDSASVIAHTPRTSFVAILTAKGMSEDSAVAVHDHAVMIDLRNEQAWTALLASKSQWSPASMSANGSASAPSTTSTTSAGAVGQLINYTNLFGDVYINPCDDCSSVTSAAAYFVDLLRMLKNCPSDPTTSSSASLLAKLLERRPDLRDLELTCANTNVLIPYVDLANEVMESFISNMPTTGTPTTVAIQAFNMTDGDSSDLTSGQPQRTQFSLYADKIDKQLFPLDVFPYNQAIDTIRSYASAFGASRYDVMAKFQSKYRLASDADAASGPTFERGLAALKYSLAAESLNLQPSDHVAVTGTSTFPRTYFTDKSGKAPEQTTYATTIGLSTAQAYWGFPSFESMISETDGLPNVAKQFLPRAKVSLQELLDLLKSRFLGGRLVLSNSADAPIFNTNITDLVLRHPSSSNSKGSLTAADCFALQAFIRLWRKCQWSLYDLDVALSYFSDQTGAADAIPLITADSIASLSAVQELQRLTGNTIEELMPLWGVIDSYGDRSLYARLFLQGNPGRSDPIFGRNSRNRFLADPQVKLSDNSSAVAAAFGIANENFDSILLGAGVQNDTLNLANLSAIYRVSLLCQILEISPLQYSGFIGLFRPGFSPFRTPQDTVKTLRDWRACVAQGISLPQVMFITGIDQTLQLSNPQYGLSQDRVVTTASNILNGLLTVAQNHPLGSDITAATATVSDLIRVANLVFDPNVGPQVADFIEGVGTTPRTAQSPIWQNILMPYFKSNDAEARSVLFEQTQPTGTAEDVAVALETQSINRRILFLKAMNPLLRTRLTGDMIVQQISELIPGNDVVLARTLVNDLIRSVTTAESAMQLLGKLLDNNNSQIAGSTGPAYFQAPSTDTYVLFFADSTGSNPPTLMVDGTLLKWTAAKGGWSSNDLKFNLGQSYALITQDLTKFTFSNARSTGLSFGPDVLVYSNTVQSTGDVVTQVLRAAEYINTFSLTLPTIQFMSSQAGSTTLSVNFSKLTYDDVRRAQRFNNLRQRTAATEMFVIDFFTWVVSRDPDTSLADKLSGLTGIPRVQTEVYLKERFPTLQPSAVMQSFGDDEEVLKLLDASEFASGFQMPGVGFGALFKWSTPLEPAMAGQYYDQAADIRKIIKLLPPSDAPDDPVTKANDLLRVNQRQALATYLLQQNLIQTWGIFTFGNLFEFFLIDVQMSPCLQTSRLKQAISTVQLYTQRCILGLEKSRGVSSGAVNLDRWTWMRKYRLWEANRKVFLYPENWLEPSLRDNKSEHFQALETELLGADLSDESIQGLIRKYIYGVNQVADLGIVAYSWDRVADDTGTMHFFGRTKQAPYEYFYRNALVAGTPASLDTRDSFTQWTAWSKIGVDIPSIETDNNATPLQAKGCYLAPAIKDKRLFLFLPTISLKAMTDMRNQASTKSYQELGNENPRQHLPRQSWHIQMAWTEYRNGKWSAKVVAPPVLIVGGAKQGDWSNMQVPITSGVWGPCLSPTITVPMWEAAAALPSVSSFRFSTYTRPGSGDLSVVTIVVDRWISVASGACYRYPCGAFELRGEDIFLLDRDAFELTPYAIPFTATVPTSFNKLIWPTSAASAVPDYRVALTGSTAVKPYWATIGTVPAGKSRPKSTFTMSFDLSRFSSAPHGLVVELQWPDLNQTLFSQVKIGGKTDGTYDVSTSDEMSNTLWPAVLNATTTNAQLTQAYAVLSNNVAQEKRYQLFGTKNTSQNECSMPAAVYTWELGVHVIMLLMERLRDLQQWELGIRVARYVFDPTIDGSNLSRCWKFQSFKDIATDPQQTVEGLLRGLSASSGAESSMSPNVLASRRTPFNAHVIARGRPVAYMKRFVMTYIEMLIGGGDDYFRQNTLESLPMALQSYIEASHLFGSPPTVLPKMGRRAARSYAQLDASFNDFGNASFDLELDFPFWCDPSKRGGTVTDTSPSYGLTGMLRSTYFCVPTNPKLMQLKNLIDDRLFKIRNCQDINGIARSLSLFEPPIDVGAALKAMAAGVSLDVLLNDSVGSIPNFRFAYLLERALDMCSGLKDMGSAFQAAKETRDAEALAALQTKQDRVMQEMAMTTKILAQREISKSIDELLETRKGHVTRLNYWLALTGDDKQAPTETSEWEDLNPNVSQPSTDGQAISVRNRLEMSKMDEARGCYVGAAAMDGVAAVIKAIPDISTHIEPIGVGCEISGVTGNIADSLSMVAGVIRSAGDIHMLDAAKAARKEDFASLLQERRNEINAAGRDVKIVDRQIATLRVSEAMCQEDIRQQKQMITHAAEIGDFLRSKYTSAELYIWMDGQLRNLFYQTYVLANDLAKKAQKLYRYERCTDNTEYITQGYWNASRDGLLSGENLFLDLKRLELAYNSTRGHDFEMVKNVSVRNLQPLAIVNLRETSITTFSLPEVLFDFDYPGHYVRRIKSLSVSIVTSSDIGGEIDATLRLLDHRYRGTAGTTSSTDYPMKSVSDERFNTGQVPITAIAVSQTTDDSGCFDYELEFNDYQRYVPFEGAGVISKWQLDLPTTAKQFDYSLINDIVIKLKYTSINGGSAFRKSASDAAKAFLNSVTNLSSSEGLFALVEVPKDFPSQWTTLSAKNGTQRSVTLSGLQNRLPYFTKSRKVKVETITAYIAADTAANWASLLTLSGQGSVSWKAGTDLGQFKTVTQTGLAERFTDWTVGLTTGAGNNGLQNLFFIVRYYLG